MEMCNDKVIIGKMVPSTLHIKTGWLLDILTMPEVYRTDSRLWRT